ncbi:ATPase [hydrothermal vent metagenome]|uniref:ATPase n=1 Tax=hydrothermal vent metagenome TaxID=652676 RepID=A0A1W1C7B0_9ZZZZ
MIERKIQNKIVNALKNFRVVIVSGPRQAGKTTLVKAIAKELGLSYYTFDDSEILVTAQNHPKDFIKFISKNRSAIDEVQYLPEIIPAIKMVVDEKNKRGMFLLTGSSDIQRMSSVKESLVGRMVGLELYPLSTVEIEQRETNIIDLLFSDDIFLLDLSVYNGSIEYLTEKLLEGGYPEIIGFDEENRRMWYDAYVEYRIIKDAKDFESINANKAQSITMLLKLLATQVSSLISFNRLSKKLKIADKTVAKYISILEAMYIVKLIEPYFNNRGNRLTKAKKVHFIDTGLVANLLHADRSILVNKGEIYGNLVESFVFTELLKQSTFSKNRVSIYHYRDTKQREVDFVLELANGDIVGIEVKSGNTIKAQDTKGMVSLAEHAKEKFLSVFP